MGIIKKKWTDEQEEDYFRGHNKGQDDARKGLPYTPQDIPQGIVWKGIFSEGYDKGYHIQR